MTDFPYIGGIEVSAIKNREFIRIETDKAQAIVVALAAVLLTLLLLTMLRRKWALHLTR